MGKHRNGQDNESDFQLREFKLNWQTIILTLGAVLLIAVGYTTIRKHPDLFSKKKFEKSVYTLGLLTMMMIIVIAVCVVMLRVDIS